ncbi:MAG: hypothetical protein ACFB03_11225 [Paracoccaceae bacterium]
MREEFVVSLICALLGGADTEVRHQFDNRGDSRHVEVDCETPSHVIEFGYDKRSSQDSVHQAVFASILTGKTPMVVLIDTDGEEGRWEQEMRRVTSYLDIEYHRCHLDFIIRWRRTRFMREQETPLTNDLPSNAYAKTHCTLELPNLAEKLEDLPSDAAIVTSD